MMMNFISGVNMFFLFKMHLDGSWRDFRAGPVLMLEEMTANHHVAKFMRVHALDESINLFRQSRSDEDLRLLPALDWPIK
jgi:hypothetical protein